jgi:hypothetical protein
MRLVRLQLIGCQGRKSTPFTRLNIPQDRVQVQQVIFRSKPVLLNCWRDACAAGVGCRAQRARDAPACLA